MMIINTEDNNFIEDADQECLFVSIDEDFVIENLEAVIIDVDGISDMPGAVFIDDSLNDTSDFIMLTDDDVFSVIDTEMLDMTSLDLEQGDISIVI